MESSGGKTILFTVHLHLNFPSTIQQFMVSLISEILIPLYFTLGPYGTWRPPENLHYGWWPFFSNFRN